MFFYNACLDRTPSLFYHCRKLSSIPINWITTTTRRFGHASSHHSAAWIQRQLRDRYVLKAQQLNYRSRSAFKLIQLDDIHLFLRKHYRVVDLGCYPGGWSQVAVERCFPQLGEGCVIGVDIQRVEQIKHAQFIQQDIKDQEVITKLNEALNSCKADLVLCDIAPPLTGSKADDHLQSADLCLHAFDITEKILRLGGGLVIKMLSGSETENYKVLLRSRFEVVKSAKPRASRQESSEIYFVCKSYKGKPKLSQDLSIKGAYHQ